MATEDKDKGSKGGDNDAPKNDAPKAKKANKRWRWLINNEERMRRVALRGVITDSSKVPSAGESFRILPGADLVEERLWARWKEQNADREVDGEPIPGQVSLLLRGLIPNGGHPDRKPERAGKPYLVEKFLVASKDTPLADLDEAAALEIISELEQEPILRACLRTERRAAVAAALSLKIEEFAKADKPAVA